MGSLRVDLIINRAIEDLDCSPPHQPQLAFHPQDFASELKEGYAKFNHSWVPPLEYKAEKNKCVISLRGWVELDKMVIIMVR